jgi:hypothetical protein
MKKMFYRFLLRDWFPPSRRAVLIMARAWVEVMALKGALWRISDAELAALLEGIAQAQSMLDAAVRAERTAELTAAVNRVFGALEALMRSLKDRYFKKPPLEDEDFASLLLIRRDLTSAVVPRPVSRVVLTPHCRRGGLMEQPAVAIACMPGDVPPEDCRVEVFRRLGPAGQCSPEGGFRKLLETHRSTEVITVLPEEAGLPVTLRARYVNEEDEAGPWGPELSLRPPAAGGT